MGRNPAFAETEATDGFSFAMLPRRFCSSIKSNIDGIYRRSLITHSRGRAWRGKSTAEDDFMPEITSNHCIIISIAVTYAGSSSPPSCSAFIPYLTCSNRNMMSMSHFWASLPIVRIFVSRPGSRVPPEEVELGDPTLFSSLEPRGSERPISNYPPC